MSTIARLEREINGSSRTLRLKAAQELGELSRAGKVERPVSQEVNNHVHTTYSFSPYEPAAAAWAAYKAGLGIVGSVDHDSIGAAEEMMEAGALIGIATTVGFEVRVSFLDTPLAKRKINNPDSEGIAYICIHGVPAQHIDEVKAFLAPITAVRNERNRAQVRALMGLIGQYGFDLDFDRDVLPLSRYADGGSVTERHILYAMARQTIEKYGKGDALVTFLTRNLAIPLSSKIEALLLDAENPHYVYDLLGVYKGSFLDRFFIQPSREECIDVREAVAFANRIGAIAAYAYLGDVAQSPTGDKKAEQFEDSFLEELLDLVADIGFKAVTYMPPRNTKEQMARLQALVQERGLMEISGVDINSSRQSMNCPELLEEEAHHLIDAAWALVAHEKLGGHREEWGLFSRDNPFAGRSLSDRIALYAQVGRAMDPSDPPSIIGTFEELV